MIEFEDYGLVGPQMCYQNAKAEAEMKRTLKVGRWYGIRTKEFDENLGFNRKRLIVNMLRLIDKSRNIAVFQHKSGQVESFRYSELFLLQQSGSFRKLKWDEVVG